MSAAMGLLRRRQRCSMAAVLRAVSVLDSGIHAGGCRRSVARLARRAIRPPTSDPIPGPHKTSTSVHNFKIPNPNLSPTPLPLPLSPPINVRFYKNPAFSSRKGSPSPTSSPPPPPPPPPPPLPPPSPSPSFTGKQIGAAATITAVAGGIAAYVWWNMEKARWGPGPVIPDTVEGKQGEGEEKAGDTDSSSEVGGGRGGKEEDVGSDEKEKIGGAEASVGGTLAESVIEEKTEEEGSGHKEKSWGQPDDEFLMPARDEGEEEKREGGENGEEEVGVEKDVKEKEGGEEENKIKAISGEEIKVEASGSLENEGEREKVEEVEGEGEGEGEGGGKDLIGDAVIAALAAELTHEVERALKGTEAENTKQQDRALETVREEEAAADSAAAETESFESEKDEKKATELVPSVLLEAAHKKAVQQGESRLEIIDFFNNGKKEVDEEEEGEVVEKGEGVNVLKSGEIGESGVGEGNEGEEREESLFEEGVKGDSGDEDRDDDKEEGGKEEKEKNEKKGKKETEKKEKKEKKEKEKREKKEREKEEEERAVAALIYAAVHVAEERQAEVDAEAYNNIIQALQTELRQEVKEAQAEAIRQGEKVAHLEKELQKTTNEYETRLREQHDVDDRKRLLELQQKAEEEAAKLEEAKLYAEAHEEAALTLSRANSLQTLNDLLLRVKALREAFYTKSEESRKSHKAHKLAMSAFLLEEAMQRGVSLQKPFEILVLSVEGSEKDPLVEAAVNSVPEKVKIFGAPNRAQLQEKLAELEPTLRTLSLTSKEGGGVVAHALAKVVSLMKVKEKGTSLEGGGAEAALARAEALLAAGELEAAAGEVEEAVRGSAGEAKGREWGEAARSRAVAEQALTLLKAHATTIAAGLS